MIYQRKRTVRNATEQVSGMEKFVIRATELEKSELRTTPRIPTLTKNRMPSLTTNRIPTLTNLTKKMTSS